MSSFQFEAWPTEIRVISQLFGANPSNYAQFGLPGHEGIDIKAPPGSRIFAVAPGRVKRVHLVPRTHNYGIHVRIQHVDGYETIYAHLKEAHVKVGDRVEAGDTLGLADNTGNSFGDHLHLTLKREDTEQEPWPSNIIDPTGFLLPLLGWKRPLGPYTTGWVYTAGLIIHSDLAQIISGGLTLRDEPTVQAETIDRVPEGTLVILQDESRGGYSEVNVPTSALESSAVPEPANAARELPPDATTVDGWAWKSFLKISGLLAVVLNQGINLRAKATRDSKNRGVLKGGSTVEVLGSAENGYLPVRALLDNFVGPVDLSEEAPAPPAGDIAPPEGSMLGWLWTPYLDIIGWEAIVGGVGLYFRSGPSRETDKLGLVRGGAVVAIVGKVEDDYTPVFAREEDVLRPVTPRPPVQQPRPLTEADLARPPQDSTPGWGFSAQLTVEGDTAVTGRLGINLREGPKRTAKNLGYVPAGSQLIVTGEPNGEYTPVRVPDDILQPPLADMNPDPVPLGNARIGLHASADPYISDEEIADFTTMRPGMIKVLSFHDPRGVAQLATNHPDAKWVVRTFLDFGGRNIRPDKFLEYTLSDTRRTLDLLRGRDFVVELHNEPNLTSEGLMASWSDGGSFGRWWLEVLRLYRQALPGVRFIYPGLSPGSTISGIKEDHIRFAEESRTAIEAADGLGVHLYWSDVYPMEKSLDVLDDYISRFRYRQIWVTEASNNKGGTSPYHKAQQYLDFWNELQKRPIVQGVTYFVASASNPAFAEEVWVGRNIAKYVGRR